MKKKKYVATNTKEMENKLNRMYEKIKISVTSIKVVAMGIVQAADRNKFFNNRSR